MLVIHGDGADAELLSEERITEMDAFVALTGLDETNIILAMYASQLNSCKVVAKINRNSFAELATAKGMVDSVVSTASVTSESIAMYVRAMQNSFESENIKTLHRLVGGRVEALEFNVAPGLPLHRCAAQGSDAAQGACWWQASCAAAARRSFPPAMTPCRRGTMWSLSPPTRRCTRYVTL